MISVAEARAACLALTRVLETETVPLREAAGRVLAEPVTACRDQPPFSASAMDGYAVRNADVAPGVRLRIVGEAAAGHAWAGSVGTGEACRIFTGAPLPEGADRVVIQEDVTREGDAITLRDRLDTGHHVRPAGGDFRAGDNLDAPRLLTPATIALAASMGHAALPVRRKPEVALIATGDELVQPGDAPRPDQIVASNSYGLAAMVEAAGGIARMLPIARDDLDSLAQCFRLAQGADLIVTIGGASVGDHDLVGEAAGDAGMEQAFYKVAMRPGKPLMAGRLGDAALLGLPGNPVSSIVCGHVFMLPMLRAFLGLDTETDHRRPVRLGVDLGPNGPREHYMRAHLEPGEDLPVAIPFDNQDSSLLTRLAAADALLIRPPDDPARKAGETLSALPV